MYSHYVTVLSPGPLPSSPCVESEGRGCSWISQLSSRMEDCWAKKHRLSVPSIYQKSYCAICVTKRTIPGGGGCTMRRRGQCSRFGDGPVPLGVTDGRPVKGTPINKTKTLRAVTLLRVTSVEGHRRKYSWRARRRLLVSFRVDLGTVTKMMNAP